MKSKIFLQLIILLLSVFPFMHRAEAKSVPENQAYVWVEKTGYKLIDALANPDLDIKYQMVDEIFESHVDIQYMAKFVLGKYWRDLLPEQQETYLSLFKRYTLSLYKNYPLNFDAGNLNFKITTVNVSENFTDVGCLVKLPAQYTAQSIDSITIIFKLSQNQEEIKIVDLKIGESSLLLTYRSRFMRMIKDADEDMVWFLDDLANLAASNEKNAEMQLGN